MDIKKLIADMPGMAEKLGKMMVDDALGAYQDGTMSLDEATPSVSISYVAGGKRFFKLTLSFEWDDPTPE